jgi:hypothetical protein
VAKRTSRAPESGSKQTGSLQQGAIVGDVEAVKATVRLECGGISLPLRLETRDSDRCCESASRHGGGREGQGVGLTKTVNEGTASATCDAPIKQQKTPDLGKR